MQKVLSRLEQIGESAWSIPVMLFVACFLAYGLLIPWQGYSYDEWHFIYYSTINGSKGLVDLFNYDGHPQSVWFYLLNFRWLGYSPLAWHSFSFVWKAANVIMFWRLLHEIWPAKKTQTFTTALLFGLYPFFTLQVFPIAYAEIWFNSFLLWLSFFLTLKAIRQPNKFWQWTILALLVKTGHVFTSEYTWFLEALRPVFIWVVLPETLSRTEKLRRTAGVWLPYFVMFFLSVMWRGFFYQPLRKSFRVHQPMLDDPVLTLFVAARHWVPDTGLTLFTSWFNILKPTYLDFANRANLVLFTLGAISTLLIFLYWRRYLIPAEVDKADKDDSWPKQALIAGGIGLIIGLFPSYAAGYTVYLSEWPGNARLALAAFPGAALILAALLEITATNRARGVIIAIVAGLLISWHTRVSNDFRRIWEIQSEFYRQLTWRIPGIAPNTIIVSTNPYLPPIALDSPAQLASAPEFAVALALNTIYSASPEKDGRIPYWYYALHGFPIADIKPTQPIREEHATVYFSGNISNIIAVYFNPEQRECLRVLGPQSANPRNMPDEVKHIIKLSRPENIQVKPKPDFGLLNTIIGPDKASSWCYFYEKAALAAQEQDWETVSKLWETAQKKGFHPASGMEFVPFIEAAARTGDWETAFELTRNANRLSPGMKPVLCPLWKSLVDATPASAQKDQFVPRIIDQFGCQP